MNICSIILVLLLSFSSGIALYSADGKASYYSDRMHGKRTANGERYDKTQLTAAHATLAFNTRVLVTNINNGKSVIVKINDRMPRSGHRLIDLSRAAAQQLDIIRAGIGSVQIQELEKEEKGQQETSVVVSDIASGSKD